jgi:hypothetical protein
MAGEYGNQQKENARLPANHLSCTALRMRMAM